MFQLVLSVFLVGVVNSRSLTSIESTPRGCEWLMEPVGDEGDEEPVLVCQIRTIGNADSVLGNLSQSQSDHVTVLKLECSDVLFFESSLEPNKYGNFLSNFRNLKDLKIEYCKIRNVPANALSSMRRLKRLSLRSHNSDWSAMTLDLHRESFRGMSELRSLDLSDNNIWNTPDEVFCPLYSLTHLNLSNNKLQDVVTLGFSDWGDGPLAPGKACSGGLEVLDLSHNDIIVLPEHGLSGLRMLQSLSLQDNVISKLGDRAFVGLISLTILNLSSNSLIELPPDLFQAPRLLTHLYLQNNSLRVLAPGLLEGLDQLQILDLSKNDLSSNAVNRDTFTGLFRLVVLNLSHNRLTKIDSNLFHDLYTLQILNLEHNSIENIAEYAFADLKNLHTLTLSNNRISYIEAFHFAGVYAMNQLHIDYNFIKHIHHQAFENLTNLQDLRLNGNLLGAVPEGIGKLRFLRTLDLGKNRIDTVVNSSFEGLDILFGLRLVDNQIVNISRDAFSTLPSLSVLNLASNNIRYVEQSAFASNPTLKAVRLDDNELTDIKGVFTNLKSLMWLNVSSNNLAIFDYSHLPVSLEWLDMHDNEISELSNYYDVRNTLKIKMLDVSFNVISEIKQNSIPESVEVLFLNNNKIKSVEPGTFMRNERLEKVVLYGNDLENLELSALSLGPLSDDIDVPQFYIGGNPFKCDCKMDWLLTINHLSNSRQYPQVLDLDAVTCELVHSRGGPPQPLLDLKPSQFLCPYESHCFAVCHCCDFDACDCEMTCPTNCTCYHDETWSSNIVDCHNAGYTEVPQNIPMDATEIYLDGNNLGELENHVFIGKKRLEVLFLNNSNVKSVDNMTFNGVASLKVLHMENNDLKELRGSDFEPLAKLNELYLDHNKISTVDNRTFQNMHRLEVLKLDENKIVNFSPWILPQVADTGIRPRVSLGGNKWSCDCSSLAPLQAWLRDSGANPSDMICDSSDSKTVADVIATCENIANAAATSVIQEVVHNGQLLGGGYVPLLAATLAAVLLICLFSAVLFAFRQDVRLWIHSKYGIRIFQDPATVHDVNDDSDRLYDCYMIYSHKDEELAGRIIASELEHLGHTLCLHYRDLHLMGGASYLADAMVSAADASRRVILIVSPALICNEWSKPEFRAALQGALHATRHKLICVLSDDPLEPMDPELRALLRACTVTRWGERRFWDKLRYAIPDVINNRLPKRSKKPPEIRCKTNARYTPTPTALDSWYKYSAMPGVHHAPNLTPTPTQSTYVSGESARSTEDEAGSSTSSQHYGSDQMNHSYVSIDGRPPQYTQYPVRTDVPQHVYSTIPETAPHSRTYFV